MFRGDMQPDATGALSAVIARDTDTSVRAYAIHALARIAGTEIEVQRTLLRHLHAGEENLRLAAGQELCSLELRVDADEMVQACADLAEVMPALEESMLCCLLQFGSQARAAVPAVERALQRGILTTGIVRMGAKLLRAAGLASGRLSAVLQPALRDRDPEVRRVAAEMIGESEGR